MPIIKIKTNKLDKNGNPIIRFAVRVNYTDEDGIKRQLTRTKDVPQNERGAKAFERNLYATIQENRSSQIGNNMTFEKLYEIYLTSKSNLKKSTLRYTKQVVRLYLMPKFQKIKIKELTVYRIEKWKIELREERPDLTLGYLVKIYRVFSAIINFAVQKEFLTRNVVSIAGTFIDTNEDMEDMEEKIHYWTKDEFMIFYNHIKKEINTSPNFYEKIRLSDYLTFFTIAFFTGVRKGENHCLTWNKIIEKQGIKSFKINESMNQKSLPYEITKPKNKSSIRNVPICNFLLKQLEEHRKLYQQVYLFNNDWFICGGYNPLTDTALENFNLKYSKLLNLPKIRVHDFRHSFASMLASGNLNILILSKLLGHTDVKTTMKFYIHLYPENLNKGIEYINSIV